MVKLPVLLIVELDKSHTLPPVKLIFSFNDRSELAFKTKLAVVLTKLASIVTLVKFIVVPFI
jgi:hypothetical protein